MKLNNLDKATKMYKAIQELDAEIIKIEKRANDLANGNFEVNVKMNFKSLDPKSEKAKFDSDGSLISEDRPSSTSRMFTVYFGSLGATTKSEEPKDQYEIKVDEKAALYILGALLQIKQEERKVLIGKIRELGFV